MNGEANFLLVASTIEHTPPRLATQPVTQRRWDAVAVSMQRTAERQFGECDLSHGRRLHHRHRRPRPRTGKHVRARALARSHTHTCYRTGGRACGDGV
jgi:hypothetical protein